MIVSRVGHFPLPCLVSFGDLQKGWVEKLVQRIVDNMEINVADIHVRYVLPRRTAAGVQHTANAHSSF